MKAVAWGLVGLLGLSLCVRAWGLGRTGSGFVTLPILTPTSLLYEADMREERGQPPGRGGAEAMDLAQELLAQGAGADPVLAQQLESLATMRLDLLALRGERHALNIRLMDVGVEVARRLSPEQWARIHMDRDALRAQAEAATFERLQQQLHGAPGPAGPPDAGR